MIYLLASFIDRENNDAIVGFRCVNVTEDNIGHYFDLEIKNLIDLVESGKLEVFNVKTKYDLEDWARYVTVFDVKTHECLNDIKYVKLSDTEYIDCLGKRYKVRSVAELDNFAYSHIFTNLDDVKDEDSIAKKKGKAKSKKDRTDDEVIFKDVCGLSYYETIKDLTDDYKDFLDYSEDVEIELLDMPKAGRFNYKLSDKKEGKLKVCKDRRTGLYGVCCVFDKYVWVVVEPKYLQLETVQSGSTTYVVALSEKEYWEFIDIKKNIKSERALEWCSVSNMVGKNGKLFVALSGGMKSGYKWYLMGKGLKIDRQIGCNMILTDALFTNIRGYTKLANTIEFYDPRHGESIIINLKDYSMEGMMNFKKSFTKEEKKEEKEVVLYYDIVCDVTVGEINFMTDKGYLEGTITFTDIDIDFIHNLSIFLNATPKQNTLDVKVKRHMAKRTHYTYQKIDVDLALKVKKFLSSYAAYTSAKVLGLYWSYMGIESLEQAIKDIAIENYSLLTYCDDGKELYIKLDLITHSDSSIDLLIFTRRVGRLIRVEYVNLVDSLGNYKEEYKTSAGFQDIALMELKNGKCYLLDVKQVVEVGMRNGVAEKPIVDIVQTYKKSKLTLKCTTYRKETECKVICGIADFAGELRVYLTSYDGLDFKTSEYGIEDIKLNMEDRADITKVREYVKIYNKVLNENQPLLGGYHAAAFKIKVN